jgi:GntR family transcriptional repressor for pyruvate dehydrogenase complex
VTAGESPYSPVQRQERLSVQVAEQISDLILSRELSTGERLPSERALCDQFGVSRTVIREAIRALEAKGLLESRGGSGTYVKALEAGDVSDSIGAYIVTQDHVVPHQKLMEVRRVLEVPVAALAAERAMEDDISKLQELVEAMECVLDVPAEFARLDLLFHVAVAEATGNELFKMLLDPFMDALYEGRRLASAIEGVPQEAVGLHRRLLEQIRAGDAEAAAEAMSEHLDQSTRVIKRGLEQAQR